MELHQRIVSAPVDFGAIRSEFGLASAYPAEATAEGGGRRGPEGGGPRQPPAHPAGGERAPARRGSGRRPAPG
ncbi:hypothetical protein, partial [Nocardia brasiliensis]|uniref:hypothetical protein n=1 Tax=Nocardia brasiliensis TaxID=37326 RepID=UPI002457B95E